MRWIRALLVLAGAFTFTFTCHAGPIVVTFETAVIEGGTPTLLPVYMAGDPNKIRLRFNVPDAALITAINSFNISVDVYDDDDAQTNEAGAIQFVLAEVAGPFTNIELASFGPGFNGTTFGSPLNLTAAANAGDLPDILAAIQNDGIFFLRVNRDGGDFYLKGGTVSIDADVVAAIPEPATWALSAMGLAACGLARRRWLSLREP